MNKLNSLKVYQKALLFTSIVRNIARTFPKQELFSLTSQFQRAADSIVLNIAEGAGNSSRKEFSRFLDYSIRSGFECIGCADIALQNKFIGEKSHAEVLNSVNEIIAMAYALQKTFSTT
jgi:four helix bundle protein